MDLIVIRGARQHNLKGIDLDLPRNRFVVITGVSGSGKSSLAFDTIHAEGQRRYLEALSSSAGFFQKRLDAPQVDEIKGLSPSIAIEQKGTTRNPRSTVGTLTEIHDYLRLLYAKLGKVHCPGCGEPVTALTLAQMTDEIFRNWPSGSRLLLLSPLGTVTEKRISKVLAELKREGYARVRVDGQVHEIDPLPRLRRRPSYQFELVVDRLILKEEMARRLSESLELAVKRGRGTAVVASLDGVEKTFSESFRCLHCGVDLEEPTPSLFSFHHPSGMCPHCKGIGFMGAGASEAFIGERPSANEDSDAESQDAGLEDDAQSSSFDEIPCPLCQGSRLNEKARSVRFASLGIHEIGRLTLPGLRDLLTSLELSPSQKQIAERPIQEILNRVQMMQLLGLSYLSLDRSVHTLSGGEAHRVRIARQIGNPLSGVVYVLDEPSIGLHPRDHERLLEVLMRLQEAGNTLIVVEHDENTILHADYVVDIGPGAGTEGGELIFAGPPGELLEHPASLTGLYLSGRRSISTVRSRKTFDRGAIHIHGASGRNLKGISVQFPLGCITCVTGVSGSGKSTLVVDTLYRALRARLHGSLSTPAPFEHLEAPSGINRVLMMDQAPIGRTPRSTPATYTGLFGLIRQLFSQLPEARARAYDPSRFSFNVKGGRCESCKGEGVQRIDMLFLPDVHVTCPNCHGSRFSRETLDIRYKGLSVADVLAMTISEASSLFDTFPAMRARLSSLGEVGLGYLRLGQPATTLSGGEAQRVKLATELGRRSSAFGTLYILDEPTTGLHFEDIRRLLEVLQRLSDQGHTIVMIEHHPDVIRAADYVIDLGPEGGNAGGVLIAAGTPEEIARCRESTTGRYLRELQERAKGLRPATPDHASKER